MKQPRFKAKKWKNTFLQRKKVLKDWLQVSILTTSLSTQAPFFRESCIHTFSVLKVKICTFISICDIFNRGIQSSGIRSNSIEKKIQQFFLSYCPWYLTVLNITHQHVTINLLVIIFSAFSGMVKSKLNKQQSARKNNLQHLK